jgi:hypothetical protein
MFVGRETVISAIKKRHEEIGQTHERVALVGLAGVGLAVPIASVWNDNESHCPLEKLKPPSSIPIAYENPRQTCGFSGSTPTMRHG